MAAKLDWRLPTGYKAAHSLPYRPQYFLPHNSATDFAATSN